MQFIQVQLIVITVNLECNAIAGISVTIRLHQTGRRAIIEQPLKRSLQCWCRRRDLYSAARPSRRNGLFTI